MQHYGGSERKYKNMSRLDVWNNEIREVRKASEDELNLMLMRSTRVQKIKRNGVYITVCGERIWYMHPEQTILHLDEEVYVRYDPADLKSVRIYNKEDRLLYIWNCADASEESDEICRCNPNDWLIRKDTSTEMVIMHRFTEQMRTIHKRRTYDE